MSERPFETQGGLFWEVGGPRFGSQDRGVPPGGALDLFALQRGNIQLGGPEAAPALEMVLPPLIRVSAPLRFVLTGARRAVVRDRGAGSETLEPGRVHGARPGDRLRFGEREYGFRSYFCWRPGDDPQTETGGVDFRELSGWLDPQGRIRVLPGPECDLLERPAEFLDSAWTVSTEMDRMGMRLLGPALGVKSVPMVSQPVADGTVQLPPGGPIVLLRHRQTVGGYPRVFNVISVDLDLLAQFGPGQRLRFVRVTPAEAWNAAGERERILAGFRDRRLRR